MTQQDYDKVATAIIEAYRQTGFDEMAPYERDGINLARAQLLTTFSDDPNFDVHRFLQKTQALTASIDRDNQVQWLEAVREAEEEIDKEESK